MPSTFTIIDARDVDGSPYEAARAAFRNVYSLLDGTLECLQSADILALNAELQRQHDTGSEMSATKFFDSALAKRLTAIKGDIASAMSAIEVLERAACHDPTGLLDVKQ